MPAINAAYLEHQRKRWMRSDAHHFVRPDWRKSVRPGFENDPPFALYENKYRPDQARVPAIRYYENVHALLDSMRAIGAGANFKVKPKGLLSVRRWRVMLKRYDKLRMEEGIPATWDMLHLVLEKTA